jgi:hypothetical protein
MWPFLNICYYPYIEGSGWGSSMDNKTLTKLLPFQLVGCWFQGTHNEKQLMSPFVEEDKTSYWLGILKRNEQELFALVPRS